MFEPGAPCRSRLAQVVNFQEPDTGAVRSALENRGVISGRDIEKNHRFMDIPRSETGGADIIEALVVAPFIVRLDAYAICVLQLDGLVRQPPSNSKLGQGWPESSTRPTPAESFFPRTIAE